MKEQICITSDRVNNNLLKTNCGVSLLDVKNHTLLQYITNLAFLIHLKLDGKSISDHPVISNLVELRIILEKIKPVEQKLKYQIDKLIRATTIENIEENNVNLTNNIAVADPLSFKPNLQDFVSKVDDKEEKVDKVEIYKVPKLAPVHFDEGNNSVRKKEQSRLIARASKSRIIKDLFAEFDDKPEEVDATGGVHAEMMHDKRIEEKLAERSRYEEENFIRLPISKNELKKLKNNSKKFEDDFENLNDFNSLATIQEDVDSLEKQRTNVLARRNARHEMYSESDDEDILPKSQSQSHEEHKRRDKQETFNGLLDGLPKNKKRKNKFQNAKKFMKSQKRRRV
ncbi:Sas10/Utp3/C1D family-domain-containing protein [Gigaspora margarita]|uniref:Sas10/Utp3/C1D family-domain-containing protein n=1 Tax=Gigaspora margarita TaxID=4874 RepID=A0A8H4A1B2_GIGMA|nr:Sas10/Utp3/C1D family-domain-containing protein [Gigaspora margarita]